MEPEHNSQDARTPAMPALAKLFVPFLILGGLGLVGLIWAGSNVLSDTERALAGNFFQTELAAPGTYEAELAQGRYSLVAFDIDRDDIVVVSGAGAEVPLAFGAGPDLDLRQAQGSTSISVTIAADKRSDLQVDQPGTYAITLLGDNGVVLTDAFEDAPGAASTGGSIFGGNLGIGSAITKNLLPLLVSGAVLLAGLVGSFAARRAKRRHESGLAYRAREQRRNAARKVP